MAGSLTTGGPARLDDNAIGVNHIVASALDRMQGGADDNDAQARHIVVADTLRAHPRPGSNSVGAIAFHATQDPISGDVSPALGTNMSVGVAFSENQRGELVESEIAQALSTGGGKPGQGYSAARVGQGLRRLTPTECERLMGWPDGWTYTDGPSLVDAPQGWPGNGQPDDRVPDGRRYSACGDGVVAHVAEWIGLGFAELARHGGNNDAGR